jgi:TolA-binding protein
VYSDPRVARFISEQLTAVRVHVREQKDEYKRLSERYDAQWTPTILILDSEGEERHRIEGFLPVDDFLAQIALGLAKAAFQRKDYADAERRFREIVDRFPSTDAAPESLYWAGVSKYKASGDPSALGATGAAFRDRYQDTAWAKKASVWG